MLVETLNEAERLGLSQHVFMVRLLQMFTDIVFKTKDIASFNALSASHLVLVSLSLVSSALLSFPVSSVILPLYAVSVSHLLCDIIPEV